MILDKLQSPVRDVLLPNPGRGALAICITRKSNKGEGVYALVYGILKVAHKSIPGEKVGDKVGEDVGLDVVGEKVGSGVVGEIEGEKVVAKA